ncbi:restriction endonuclease subunit S [Corynebacterium lizhenjunii]|uniref:Restriction endonuclease subunit S n=1 Tax=Corynebacterium lizhenjunii TaxID=2709394 RepID=A0A7T0KFM5_9CORY|nr:restriction endonuclease subunit S [Corynebacterium lizhenjunii]QPK79099.1 restriction endonuclease subunit S [Corynebacterium lizhenjunii]
MTTTQHDWPMVKLGELIQSVKPDRAQDGEFPVLSITRERGLVYQDSRFKKRIAGADLSNYKVIEHGQLVVGFPIDEAVIDFQTLCEAGIVSPAYGVWQITNGAAVDREYLRKFLRSDTVIKHYKLRLRGTTARRRTLTNEAFSSIPVPLPPLEEQHRIAGILNHAGNIVGAQRGLIEAVEELSQTTLNALLSHESRTTVELAEIADIQSGITKGRKVPAGQSTESVPYLAVSNVKDGFLQLEQVSEIEATNNEIAKYLLSAGDLVLTEGGDPDKLGRGTVWNEELPRCIHQNHIFRVRIRPESSEITPEVLAAALRTPSLKQYFLKSAKQTTGIASINKTQLSQAPIPVLNSDEVGSIAETIVALQAELALERKRLDSLIGLQKVLSIRAFQGEL